MAVSTRNRRRIVVNERTYVWFVRDDGFYSGDCGNSLWILSMDKRIKVRFPIVPECPMAVAVVEGNEFPGLKRDSYCNDHVELPRHLIAEEITPRLVRELVLWILDPAKPITRLRLNERSTSMRWEWVKDESRSSD